MRLVLAARLSQLAKGQTGLDTQDEDARAWAAAHGHTIVAATPDRISGRVSPFDRPKLGPWLTDPKRMALYDGILVSKIDRLTRKEDWDIRQWAEEHGKRILVVSPQLEWPPPMGEAGTAIRIIWDNLVNLAAGEWENTSMRYRRMQRALRDQAFFVGKPPYGYHIVQVDGTDHKTLEPDPVTSAIVRGMANRYLEGQSLNQIRDWLTASAIPEPQPPKGRQGKGWTAQAVRRILHNQAIAGRVQTNGKTVLRVEPLISVEDFRRIESAMKGRATRGAQQHKTAMLTGLLFCQNDHPMYRLQGRKIPSVPDGQYYYCRECPKGERLLVPLAKTDQAVNDSVMAHEDEPYFVTEVTPGDDWAEEIDRVRQDIRELDPETDDYDTQLRILREELKRLRSLPTKPAKVVRKPEGRTIGVVWQSLDAAGRRKQLLTDGARYTPQLFPDGHVSVVGGPDPETSDGGGLYEQIESLVGPPRGEIYAV
jgi:site-specific DNA recombinase